MFVCVCVCVCLVSMLDRRYSTDLLEYNHNDPSDNHTSPNYRISGTYRPLY